MCVLALYFLACAAYYLLTSLIAIVNFAWRQPMYDQWRTYTTLIGESFPANVFQVENGHRPIIPNLIRVAELRWFGASQLLQISVGTACVIATVILLWIVVWRQRAPVVARCACIMLSTIGLFWLANARMLLHGYEMLHVYTLALAVVGAALCTYEAKHRQSFAWYGAATAACVVAMFCFGPGVASFPAIVLLGLALRLPSRWILLPLATLAVLLLIYLFGLPGNQSVRKMAELQPIESSMTAARWLASPWINGWLGLADPPQYGWLIPDTLVGDSVKLSANSVSRSTGMNWRALSTVIGFAGIAAFLWRLGASLKAHKPLDRLEVLMTGIGVFALATAAEIGVMRLGYLIQNPQETYSDRYLVWPSLFWMSLAILAVHDASRRRRVATRIATFAFAALLPIVLSVTQNAWAGWGATVYRGAQQLAAGARSNVIFPALLLSDAAANHDMRLATLAALRSNRLAMFADDAWEHVGELWAGSVEHNVAVQVVASSAGTVADLDNDRPALHFEGYVERGISTLHNRQLAALDESSTIVGLAEFSFIAPGANALRLDVPHKRGFDGYIKNYDPARRYTLAALDLANNRALSFGEIIVPAAAPGN